MDEFAVDPGFLNVSEALGDLGLCAARLYTDARYPWIVLIPRRAGVRELEDLSPADRALLMDEILISGQAVRAVGERLERPVFKLNVAALGNVTPQLHIHVLGRRPDDPTWPDPVWGKDRGQAQPYEPSALAAALATARTTLGL
jgi:diadenosine tetraphosphate (Ap4A) HIT family hydrolase